MDNDYKTSKEAFVSGIIGSSVLHVNMISAVALCSVALHSVVQSRLPIRAPALFCLEWSILVLPLLFAITLFAAAPALLSVIILIPTAVLYFFSISDNRSPLPPITELPSSSDTNCDVPPSASKTALTMAPLPWLTIYRAHMLLMTFLSILAVDFPVFPRFLAKCETYGVSLMDLGVGSFVFSQGVVSAIPFIRDPSYLTASTKVKFMNVLCKVLPIFFLGIIRVLLVKGAEYPEHVTEYGVHWNFFMTLALLPMLQVLMHPVIAQAPISLIGVCVAVLHQLALSVLGLEDFVLSFARSNLISANKEGIVSIPGYMAIHLLGLSIGTIIFPSSSSYFRKQQRDFADENTLVPFMFHRQDMKLAFKLCAYTVLWWAMMESTRIFNIGGGVSRRMVNLSYVLWVAAFNSSFLLGYLLLEMFFSFPPSVDQRKSTITSGSTGMQRPSKYECVRPPPLLEAINKNGMTLFLLANIATGIVNLAIPTMYTSDMKAMAVLVLYSLGLCLVAWATRGRNIWRI